MAQKGFEVTPVDSAGTDATDTVNHAIKVNVVAGGAGGGIAQLQVRSTDDSTWVNVGTGGAVLPVPVTVVSGGSTSSSPVVLSASTAQIGHVIIDTGSTGAFSNDVLTDVHNAVVHALETRDQIIQNAYDAANQRLIVDGSQVNQPVILTSSTTPIGSVSVTTLPTLILSSSTSQIGRVVIDTGSTVSANITNVSLPVTQSGTWIVSTASGTPAFVTQTATSVAASQSGTWVVSTASGIPAWVTQTATAIAAAQSGTWVISTASGTPAWVTQTATSIAAAQNGTWIISTSSANPARVDPTGTTPQPASQNGTWVVSTSSANPAFVRINDNGLIMNATNVTNAGLSNNALISERSGRWSVTSNPGIGASATASKSSGGTTVKHIADTVIFSSNTTAAPAAITRLTFNLRDGLTGAGTILASWTFVMSTTVIVQNLGPMTFDSLNLMGSANTAMTFECTSTTAATTAHTVTLIGYDVS